MHTMCMSLYDYLTCCLLLMVSSALVCSASFLISCCLNISFSLSLDCSCCCNSATSCTETGKKEDCTLINAPLPNWGMEAPHTSTIIMCMSYEYLTCFLLLMVSSALLVCSASFLVTCCLNISFSLLLDCSCCCSSATSCTGKRERSLD